MRSDLTGVDTIQNGEFSIPALQESVSVQKDGTITVTLANLSAEQSYPVKIALTEKKNRTVSAKILTGAMNAHNTFEEPDAVKEESFEGVAEKDGTLSLKFCVQRHLSADFLKMDTQKKPCLKCLLRELDEEAYMKQLHRYIVQLDPR